MLKNVAAACPHLQNRNNGLSSKYVLKFKDFGKPEIDGPERMRETEREGVKMQFSFPLASTPFTGLQIQKGPLGIQHNT